MRKVMRTQVATAAKLDHRMTCTCPEPSTLPEGPMVGTGGGASCCASQFFRAGGMGAEGCFFLGENFVPIRIQNSGKVIPLKCRGESVLFLHSRV